jgi:hypothetical protein
VAGIDSRRVHTIQFKKELFEYFSESIQVEKAPGKTAIMEFLKVQKCTDDYEWISVKNLVWNEIKFLRTKVDRKQEQAHSKAKKSKMDLDKKKNSK